MVETTPVDSLCVMLVETYVSSAHHLPQTNDKANHAGMWHGQAKIATRAGEVLEYNMLCDQGGERVQVVKSWK